MNKPDIHLGMIAGNICPKCRAILVIYGIHEKAIYSAELMLNYVRSEDIGKPIIFDENAAFIVMRFSKNDENDRAYLHGIKSALEKIKIKCLRADDQISSGQLLEKIEKILKKVYLLLSRLI